ncbi:hypothetical protein [Gelidibacter maritimus]|uniref:Uncharacterized protein n=1 Tax=Gelidibacter maritimus TaxID=2761487 RepID=A0A7W2M4S1_9FLAO|nr:hypothetical protein [Gelidibacter maritimus]MBA6152701.1 hypothetical protein [Gelidibacter maritimus]
MEIDLKNVSKLDLLKLLTKAQKTISTQDDTISKQDETISKQDVQIILVVIILFLEAAKVEIDNEVNYYYLSV